MSAGAARQDFSLVLGGPFFQLLRKARLSDDAMTLVRRRMLASVLVTWLPLLLLSALQGRMLGGGVAVPFLEDVDVQVKLLLALPLLIVAELVVHVRLRHLVDQFRNEGLITPAARSGFEAAIASAMKLRNSALAEALLIVFVYVVGVFLIWRRFLALGTSTWYLAPSTGEQALTLAGLWYGFVSLPIFQFLLARWLYRLFIWTRFLRQVSRLELNLIPTHPDRAGGLGFLSGALFAFVPLAMAFGVMVSGALADRIFFSGAKLADFKIPIATAVVAVVVLFGAPFLAFFPKLARTRRQGVLEYGTLAHRYVRDFDSKWLRGGAPATEPLVGSADVQSLADLASGYEIVRTMRSAPVTFPDILRLAAATLVPVAPLVLTVMPLGELVKLVLGLLR